MEGASLDNVLKAIERFAPPGLAEPWDRIGLQVGERGRVIRSVLVALDPSTLAVNEAARTGADLLITHHPLLLEPITSVDTATPKGSIIKTLLASDIALYSAHTNLDKTTGGVNDCLAKNLGLQKIEGLAGGEGSYKVVVTVPLEDASKVREAMTRAGAGTLGNYSGCFFTAEGTGTFKPLDGADPFLGQVGKVETVEEAKIETLVVESLLKEVLAAAKASHPYEMPAIDTYPLEGKAGSGALGRIGEVEGDYTLEEFASFCAEKLEVEGLRYAGKPSKKIRRVALCGGSGGDLWKIAKARGADLLVTGDLKYHQTLDAVEEGFALIDGGHCATERVVLETLADLIKRFATKSGADIKVSVFTEDEPFRFLKRA